jgi:Cell wall-associated hydrolases (invasion-associated proteins)
MKCIRLGIVLLSSVFMFSGCLSRKDSLPPVRSGKKGVIATDAAAAPKGIRSSGSGLLSGYAAVLGVSAGELRTPALYRYIDSWMGVRHRTGGTDRRGLDCSAFVGMVMRDVYGKSLPRVSAAMADHVNRARKLEEGDLVFFSFGRRGIDHVGIYLQNHKFVHVSTSKGVIISDLRDSWYAKYFSRGGRVQ